MRLVRHRIWTPTKGHPLDLEETIEAYLLFLAEHYRIHSVRYDPIQMERSAATLSTAGIRMVEFPQTTGNLTAATTDLYDLVRDGRLSVYPDAELRQHVMNAVAIETPRGWRLAKEKSSRKIDGAVALSFACVGANAASSSSGHRSMSTLPEPRDQVVRRGDLVLRGSHYVRPSAPSAPGRRAAAARRDRPRTRLTPPRRCGVRGPPLDEWVER